MTRASLRRPGAARAAPRPSGSARCARLPARRIVRPPGAPPHPPLKKQIVINASKDRSRIAIVEDGELVELYVENPENVRTLGNIYLGRVQKVMPTLRAAFVDVGLKQDAFLHFSDLTDNAPQLLALAGEDIPGLDAPVLSLAPSKRIADDDSEPDVDESLEVEAEPPRSRTSRRRRGGRGRSRRVEEEDEQEEVRPRRRPMVIDLTSKPSRPAPPAPPREEPAAAAPAAEPPAEDEADVAPVEIAAEAPRSRRRTRAAEPAADGAPDEAAAGDPIAEIGVVEPLAADESAGEPLEDAVAGDETAAAAPADDEPRRRRRGGRRRGRGSRDASAEDASDDATVEDAETPADAVAEVAPADDAERAPRGRRSRGRAAEASEMTDDADDEVVVHRAPRRASDPARARVDALLDAALSDLTAPVARRPVPVVADDEEPAEATATATPVESSDDTVEEADDTSRRRRGGRRRGRGSSADAGTTEQAAAETADAEAAPATDAKADDASSDDEAPRSRRGSRRTRDGAEGRTETRIENRTEAPTERARESSRDTAGRGSDTRGSDSRRSDGRSSDGREARPAARPTKLPPTEELLRRDGRVLVKITKEPISSKGCRVSTDLSLAGRFLVLVPAADYVAVSKKIESARERRRLRTLAQELKPDGFGVIVRTVADGRDAKSLETDLRLLTDKWRKIERKLAEAPPPPVLLYEDVNMVSSIIRDLFSDDFDRILVDDPRVFKNVQAYVRAVAPHMADKVELHKSGTPVYRAVGIERQVEEAFSKRVNLKGGGYLFIETTEAMHVVDVNSGRAGRGKSQKDNLIAVNVEAAREVAKQLRLRDLGGIIVVDFIDLKYERDRKKVTDALKEAFAKDRAVTKLLPMSDFGLVQITRQRLRPSITTTATDEDGEPRDAAEAARLAGAAEIAQPERRWEDDAPPPPEAVLTDALPEDTSPEGLTANLRAWLGRYREAVDARYKDRPIVVRVHPLLGAHLRRGFVSTVTKWKWSLRGIPFRLLDDPTMHPLTFDVRDEKSGRSLRKKYE